MTLTLEPNILRWARERANLDVPVLAKKIRVAVNRVEDWEQTGNLTFSQAKKLAHVAEVVKLINERGRSTGGVPG